MRDKLFSGAVAGLIGAGIVGLISSILKSFRIYEYTYMDIAASLIYPYKEVETLAWYVVGWLNNFIIGIILGIILVYILAWTGKDYGILKGTIFGLVWWFILTVIIQPELFEWGRFHETKSLVICLFRDVLFGIVTSYIIIKYTDLINPV